ncbi:MAG: RnfABCDGE type electron transport complex subunit D [Bacilli bacterium]|nr:RnfABCDGE type electron transport complex subunit D [Bacilli bacterium]
MKFITKKPPIVMNSQRTYKKLFTLHFALIVVAIGTVVIKALSKVPETATYTSLDLAFKALAMLVLASVFSVVIEIFYALSEKNTQKFESYKGFVDPINTGLLIALLLPSTTPFYVLALAVFVGVYIGKLVFGGYGFYIFNPALVGVLFANISFNAQLALTNTPLELLKRAIGGESITFKTAELFLGNYNEIAIGSTSVILLALIFIYLLVTRVIDFRISGTFLITVLVITFGVGYINFYAPGDFSVVLSYVLVNMITGLTVFGAVFLISESVSSPTTRETKIIYAVVIGVFMMMVRTLGSQTEGLVFAILFGNMITPLINRTVKRSNAKMLVRTVIACVVIVLLVTVALGLIVQSRLPEVAAIVGGAF